MPSTVPVPNRRGLRVKEAADYLGVTNWFMEIAVREKKIPAQKLGRHYVLFREDLDAFVDSLRSKSGGAA